MASQADVRMSLVLSEGTNEMLEQVAAHNATTKADVLRRAIALIAFADKLKQRGESLAVTDSNRKLVAEVVSPW